MLISKLILKIVSCWLGFCAAEGCCQCLAPVPSASHPAHASTGCTVAGEDGTNGFSRGQEHVHLQVPQLALVKPVLKALPERRPSFCCLGDFYTSKSGFVMMPETKGRCQKLCTGWHEPPRCHRGIQKFPELKIVSEDVASGHSGRIAVIFRKAHKDRSGSHCSYSRRQLRASPDPQGAAQGHL